LERQCILNKNGQKMHEKGCTSLTNVYYNGTIEDWCNISFSSSSSNPMCYASHFYMLDENNEYKEVTEIVIPETVTKIGDYKFYGFGNITNITIPNSVISIGKSAFGGCTSLTSMTLPFIGNGGSETHFGYIFGATYKSVNYGYVPTTLKEVTITGYKGIGNFAFGGCTSLTNIIISGEVTKIDFDAFFGCTSLKSISIPNSVKSIGQRAFSSCKSLTNMVIPNSVTSIGSSAFSGCNSLTYNIYDNCKYLGNDENPYLVLVKATNTSIQSISINPNTKFIGSSAFEGCTRLTSIEIPNSVTSIGGSAFEGCTSLTSIEIPNSVTSIDHFAFYRCTSLKSIFIPNSVKSIGHHAFSSCKSLTSIVIPDSVTSIGDDAFEYCTSLTIYCEALKKPSRWANNWNPSNCNVVWGYKKSN